ncbi:MAG: hypothetical protein FD180_169 [Planctomycetota bacterium]|nr:MAG: hypothetical protein FD180_169 [Planctomycetota bacterium]
MRSLRFIAIVPLFSLASAALAESPAELKTRLADSRLVFGTDSIAPARVLPAAAREERIGKHVLSLSGGEIREWREGTKDPAWIATVPGDQKIWHLAGDGDCAWVLTYEVTANGNFKGFDPEVRVRALDLVKGEWKEDLRVGSGKDGGPKPLQINAIRPGPGLLAVLSLWGTQAKEKNEGDDLTHYQVDCFKFGEAKPAWSRRFDLGETRADDRAMVWGIPGPRYAGSEIQPLTWMDDELLVCAEAQQPLLLLSSTSGRQLWKLDRVWEFERGYVGPSCYSFYIGRLRLESFGPRKEDGEAVAERRKAFDAQWSASIIGGPVVVPLADGRRGDDYSIFVAVLKCPAEGPSYLSDCLVYEFNEKGAPISIGKLPQLVEGGSFRVSAGGVLWRGQNESFARLSAARRAPEVTMGGGGPDCTARLEWFRQVSTEPHTAWFTSGLAGDPVAFGDRQVFSLSQGGFVREKDKGVYSFPLDAIAIADGAGESLVLDVPFDGEFPLPTNNVGSSGTHVWTRSFHLRAITVLEARGSRLTITLGREGGADALEFDLAATKLFAGPSRDPGAKLLDAARARVKEMKDVNALSAEGFPPLFDAIHQGPLAVKALLEAGSDPRIPAKNGSTPLLSAALYGNADVVEMLLKAGADARGNPDLLVWAAYASRQSGRKLRLLIAAGADPNAPDRKRGYTPLMTAAQNGNVTGVEVLLAAGASVEGKNNDGKTALELARDGKHQDVVEILEERSKAK